MKQVAESSKMEVSSLILDGDNPLSVVNKVGSQKLADRIREIPVDVLAMEESELKRVLKPTELMNMMRLNFWRAYEGSVQTGDTFSIADITHGVCLPEYFHHQIIKNEKVLAWILKPPRQYMNALEEALTVGVDRLREIMDLPIKSIKMKKDRHGREAGEEEVIDTKVAELILKTVMFLDTRVKGSITQRHEVIQKSMHLSMQMKGGLGKDLSDLNMVEIDKKLQELEAQSKRMLPELSQHTPSEVLEGELVKDVGGSGD